MPWQVLSSGSPAGIGRVTSTNWSDAQLLRRCDPYLVWFDLTHVVGTKLRPDELRLDILVELPSEVPVVIGRAAQSWDWLINNVDFLDRWPRLLTQTVTNKPGTAPAHAHPEPKRPPRFITGTVPASKLAMLVKHVAVGSEPKILRFELATPRVDSGGTSTVQRDLLKQQRKLLQATRIDSNKRYLGLLTGATPIRVDEWLGWSGKSKENKSAETFSWLPGPMQPPLVCVVDDGCNFASLPVSTSISSIWDQGRPSRPPSTGTGAKDEPSLNMDSHGWVAQQPYLPGATDSQAGVAKALPRSVTAAGREHYGALRAFERSVGARDVSTAPLLQSETEAYRQANYLHPAPVWTHGTAVLYAVTSMHDGPDGTDPDQIRRARAPGPGTLDFVQFPNRTVLDTSGGSLAGFALDAIHRAARRAAHGPHHSALVNLSYGTHSGPHDGSSMFERAVMDMLDLYDGKGPGRPALHVVVPAGNSQLWRCHASGWLGSTSSTTHTQTLYLKVLPDDETDSFIEIWFNSGALDVELTVISPTGERSDPFRAGKIGVLKSDDGFTSAALIYPREVAQGLHGTMALLALAPTARRTPLPAATSPEADGTRMKLSSWQIDPARPNPDDGLPRARVASPAGVWKIELKKTGPAEAAGFHAWVQRDDSAPGRNRARQGYVGRQAYLMDIPGIDSTGAPPSHYLHESVASGHGTPVDPRFTLNGIATASDPSGRFWVVGAMEESGRISRYSSAGPDRDIGMRCDGPDVVITVDRSRNQPGRFVGGTLTGSRVRLSGTSIGAAVFTRMLHHALSIGGPDYRMPWLLPSAAPAPSPPMAGEPEMAGDEYRGKFQRLRCVNNIALPRRK